MNKKLRNALSNTNGAIDLASVMVGVIIIGIIAALLAATIFVVIPWAQDNMAKEQLMNVHTAEQAYAGRSATGDNGAAITQPDTPSSPGYSFADLRQLNDSGLFSQVLASGSDNTNADSTICADTPTSGFFRAAVKSGSGNIFTESSDQPSIEETNSVSGTCFDTPQASIGTPPSGTYWIPSDYQLVLNTATSSGTAQQTVWVTPTCTGTTTITCTSLVSVSNWSDGTAGAIDPTNLANDLDAKLGQALTSSGVVCNVNDPNMPYATCTNISGQVVQSIDLNQDLPVSNIEAYFPDRTPTTATLGMLGDTPVTYTANGTQWN